MSKGDPHACCQGLDSPVGERALRQKCQGCDLNHQELVILKHLPVPGTCSTHLIPMTTGERHHFFFNHHFAGEETKALKV